MKGGPLKMNRLRTVFLLLTVGWVLFTLTNTAYTGEIALSPIGGGIGTILSGNADLQVQPDSTKEKLSQQSEVSVSTAALTNSQLVGLYELYSFYVQFDNGSIIDSANLVFSGDMAATFHNTMWQRMAVSGYQTLVGSGTYSINGNTLTIVNDLVAANSVATVSWDGTYLTTVLRNTAATIPFTETDIWRRVLSPSAPISDQDGDGVIDQWDNCPNTQAGACVDRHGCPCTPSLSDQDGDGVIDQWDKCVDTPTGVCVDKQGCTCSRRTGTAAGMMLLLQDD
jgi:hypothetical protein